MKTNASPKVIINAVDNVSKRLFEGNVILRKNPEKITKNVSRFTLRTLHADKLGSLTTKGGVKQAKADWNVHEEVMKEILKLDPRPHIYVDTIYGRQFNTNPQAIDMPMETVDAEGGEPRQRERQPRARKTRQRRTRNTNGHFISDNVRPVQSETNQSTQGNSQVGNLIKAIKYIMQHPNILNE